MKVNYAGLVGDVGGTNARLALVDEDGRIRHPKTFEAKDYASLSDVIGAYIQQTLGRKRPTKAVIAVAGPVVDGEIEFTNLSWRISEGELVGTFELEAAKLLNDFGAQAMAAPLLEAEDLRRIGPELRGAEGAPCVVVGAGTGFGVAGMARSERGDLPIPAEGGHASFSPADEVEDRVLASLRAKHGRVSVERVLSGPGLYGLYQVMAEIAGEPVVHADEKAVAAAGLAGEALSQAVLDRFCEILGSVAGDIALTYGARGGVFVSGGIAPRLIDRLMLGGFRRRFEDKGRLKDYMADIPTALIVHPYAALLGAARVLETLEGNRF